MKSLKIVLLTLFTTVLIASCGSSTTTAAVSGEVLPGRVEVL